MELILKTLGEATQGGVAGKAVVGRVVGVKGVESQSAASKHNYSSLSLTGGRFPPQLARDWREFAGPDAKFSGVQKKSSQELTVLFEKEKPHLGTKDEGQHQRA